MSISWSSLNPFTALEWKVSGLKNARTHLKTVYFLVLKHIYFQCYSFWWKSFDMPVQNKQKQTKKCLRVSNLALLLVVFKWHHGSEGVNHESVGRPTPRWHVIQSYVQFWWPWATVEITGKGFCLVGFGLVWKKKMLCQFRMEVDWAFDVICCLLKPVWIVLRLF